MIYDVTKGNIMQKLALYNPETNQYTYSYNWIGDSNIPQLVVDDTDCPLLKFGTYSEYKTKQFFSDSQLDLYSKSTSDKTERQLALQNMVKYYGNNTLNEQCFLFFGVAPKDKKMLAVSANDENSFYYELNEERTIVTGINKLEEPNLTQTLVSDGIFTISYDSKIKKYKISGSGAHPHLGLYAGRSGQVICNRPAIDAGWWYDYRDSSTYPIMYQYFKKIEDAFSTNNKKAVEVATKLKDFRAWSQFCSYNVKLNDNMCSFFDSNDCVALKEVIELFNNLQKSTSTTEKNASLSDIDKMYIVKWCAECFEKGDIVDDKVNYDDRIDFYARVDETNTINIEWVNKAVDNGQIEITENSYIEILCYKTVDDIMLNNPYSYKVPYSFGNFQLNIEDLKNTLNISPLAKYPIKITLQGYFDYGNNSLIGRNILFFEVDISEKNSFVSDYGEYSSSETYSDTINIGEKPTEDEPTEPTDDPTSDDPIDGGDVTSKNGLTTIYALTSAKANDLGQFIWNNSNDWFSNLLQVQADALSNIVSCKLLPFSLSGTGKTIKIGNINTQVEAMEIDSQVIRKSGGNLKLSRYFNNFLDYAPYTKMSLYLPFIGFTQIENEYMYDGVSIEYLFDIITGELLILLKNNNKTFRSINGSFGIDIPFSSTNKAQIEGSFASKIAKDVIDLNPIGVLDTYTDIATSRFKTSNSSSPSSVCAYSAPLQCFVTVDRPILNKPSSYNHDVGQKCVGSYYLSQLKGYTEVENIELNCPCTDAEKEEILSLLKSGVYL